MAGLAAVLKPRIDEARKSSARELRVEAVSSYSAFLRMEPVWEEVVEASGVEHPFLEHAWIRTWWECFGGGSEPRILVVREGDDPIAIAPLLVTTARMFGIEIRKLGFFYNSHVPRADFILTRRPEDSCSAIWSYIWRHRDWDLLQLSQLSGDSPTYAEIERLAKEDSCATGTWISGASPYIRLEGSWEQYHAGLAAKHRANLRNRFKRLRAIGPVQAEESRSTEGLKEVLAEGLRLEAAAWKRQAGTAIECDPTVSRFYSLLAQRAAEKGWLRLNFLRAGDARVAFDYSLEYRDRLYLLKLGYDPEFSPYSPSNLLLSMQLENAFGRGILKYDFLGESADWKRCWSSEESVNRWLFVFSSTLKARLLHSIKFQLIGQLKLAMGG